MTEQAYEFTPEMGEISGFGGGYEAGCRAMLKAGLEFWDAQPPEFDPHYQYARGVFGLCMGDNEDAKRLDAAIMAAPLVIDGRETTVGKYGATGAMHHAVVQHILFIRREGWERYVEEMSKPEDSTDAD